MWVFKCFLSFIHLLLYLKSVIAILFQQIRRYFTVSSQTCTYGKIREDSKDLAKLPRHISFVVQESDISFVDLAQLIVWSMAMGIPYISVYDREGRLFKLLCLYDAIHVLGYYSNLMDIIARITVLRRGLTFDPTGVLKKTAAALSSEIIQKQKEVFTEESSKHTFVLRTKDVKFDCELLGESILKAVFRIKACALT